MASLWTLVSLTYGREVNRIYGSMIVALAWSASACLADSELEQARELERACSPEVYDLGEGIALKSCSGQLIDAEQAELILSRAAKGEPFPEDLELSPGSAALAFNKAPDSCEWYELDVSVKAALLACPDQRYVVAGGCAATQTLNASGPWQSPSSMPPSPGQPFDMVHSLNGWMCDQAGSGADRLVTSVLCCESKAITKQGEL